MPEAASVMAKTPKRRGTQMESVRRTASLEETEGTEETDETEDGGFFLGAAGLGLFIIGATPTISPPNRSAEHVSVAHFAEYRDAKFRAVAEWACDVCPR